MFPTDLMDKTLQFESKDFTEIIMTYQPPMGL